MSEIREGDLVVVVKPSSCCGFTGKIGKVFKVTGIITCHGCIHCGSILNYGEPLALRDNGMTGYIFSRLKRIPPLSKLESIDQAKELTT